MPSSKPNKANKNATISDRATPPPTIEISPLTTATTSAFDFTNNAAPVISTDAATLSLLRGSNNNIVAPQISVAEHVDNDNNNNFQENATVSSERQTTTTEAAAAPGITIPVPGTRAKNMKDYFSVKGQQLPDENEELQPRDNDKTDGGDSLLRPPRSTLLYEVDELGIHRPRSRHASGVFNLSPSGGGGGGRDSSVHDALSDSLFNVLTEDDDPHHVSISRLFRTIDSCGLRRNDPRLRGFFKRLHRFEKGLAQSGQELLLTRSNFSLLVADSVMLLTQAAQREFVFTDFESFCEKLGGVFESCRNVSGGECAQYIPNLARADPKKWAMSACTVDGQRYSSGDSEFAFCLQAAGKPLIYAAALEAYGLHHVHNWVGKEPSGRHFNEIVLDTENKPHNPMINGGSIVLLSIIKPELDVADRFDFLQKFYRTLAGGEFVGYSNSTFLSERSCADRNFALAYYMKEMACFPRTQDSKGHDLMTTMDLYFQMCSMEVTTDSASVMAATLANGGVCPITNEKVLSSDSISRVLSLMYTCGMNDYSGQFAFWCGLPAKSGISGIILLVIPNKLGIAVYNPLVDKFGNSVKGVEFCRRLVETFNFHNFDNMRFFSTNKVDPTVRRADALGAQCQSLLFAASAGDMSTLRRLLMTGVDMAQADYDGRTALHVAASEGLLEVVKFLVDKCAAPINVRDRWDSTPLEDAVKFDYAQVAQYLHAASAKQQQQNAANNKAHATTNGNSNNVAAGLASSLKNKVVFSNA